MGSCMGCCTSSQVSGEYKWPDVDDPDAAMERLAAAGVRKYFGLESLLDSVISGAVAPLRGQYLLQLWKSKGTLCRRQDLPKEAFWTPAEIIRVCQSMATCDLSGQFGNSFHSSNIWGYLFFVISYRWLSKEHPDPDGFHLAKIGNFLESYLTKTHRYPTSQLEVISLHTSAFPDGLLDCVVFWDFGSLCQHPRQSSEDLLFKAGLKASNIWYANAWTTVWIQSQLPIGFQGASYENSGWCYIEATMSSVIKHDLGRLDLGLDCEGESRYWVYEGMAHSLSNILAVRRMPPVLPDEVARMLSTEKTFTNSADIDMVAGLYRSFFEEVAPHVEVLSLSATCWLDKEVTHFCDALPMFKNLRTVDLSGPDYLNSAEVQLPAPLKDALRAAAKKQGVMLALSKHGL